MSLWTNPAAFQASPLPRPELVLMKARLDNLTAQNQRMLREIAQLTLQIQLEERRFLAVAGATGTASDPADDQHRRSA